LSIRSWIAFSVSAGLADPLAGERLKLRFAGLDDGPGLGLDEKSPDIPPPCPKPSSDREVDSGLRIDPNSQSQKTAAPAGKSPPHRRSIYLFFIDNKDIYN